MGKAGFSWGWEGDKKNAFTGEGLNEDEKSVQDLVKKLGGFRKKSSALTSGKLMHYVPDEGLYVYFRYDSRQTIMCIMNTSDKNKTVHFLKYAERAKGFRKAIDVISGASFNVSDTPEIKSYEMWSA